jgi:hypothetical protein
MEALPGSGLAELLRRIAAAGGRALDVPGDELAGWPLDEVAALKSHRVLVPGKPADSTICPGCERACAMPVHVLPRAGRAASLFIVCDKPVDINRVAVAPVALERWRTTAQGLADALAALITGENASALEEAVQGFRLGVVKGRKDRGPVHLRTTAGDPRLMVAGHALELSLVLTIQDQRLVLDLPRLARCVDAPAGGVGVPSEAPQDRRQRLAERVEREKAKGTRAFLKVVAAEEGITDGRLKQLLKPTPSKPADWTAPLLAPGASTPKNPKR